MTADGGATQGEGVLGTGGRLADGEHAGDGVELVRDGNDACGRALGEVVPAKRGR